MNHCPHRSSDDCGCAREYGHPGYCWCTDCEETHEFGGSS